MKSVLITGAGRGYGESLLKIYLKAGWVAFPLIRDAAQVEEFVKAYPGRCHPVVGDVTSDEIGDTINRVLSWNIESLDLLINNAGNIYKNRNMAGAEPGELLNLFNVHCAGVLRCVKAVHPFLLKSHKPIIINISSRWGSITNTAEGKGGDIYSYSIAKSAQNMLTAMLHSELKADKILVHSVHPGRLLTDAAASDADITPDAASEKLFNWIKTLGPEMSCKCYDVMDDRIIDW